MASTDAVLVKTFPQVLSKSDEEEKDSPQIESKCDELEEDSVSEGAEEPVDADLVINYLPDEVWLKLLSYLSSWELCRLSLTCKSLLRLSRDPSLWTEVTLLGDAIADTHTVTSLFRSVLTAHCSVLTVHGQEMCQN